MNTKNASLTDFPDADIKNLVLSMGEPEFRVKQLRSWIYRGLAFSFGEMTNLPLAFRQALEKAVQLHCLKAAHQVVGQDGTVKTLFTLADGNTIESAMMTYAQAGGMQRNTVCVSTQAGCAIGCPFCATGQQGFRRNLTRGEIIDQVLYFAHYLKNQENTGKTKTGASGLANIVFMGMGEPLANYEALWQAIETLNSPDGFGMGARNMTISTSGMAPQIKRLGREKLQVGLAVSLHAADNALRNWLVPINKKYPLEVLLPACKEYYLGTGRRVSFEYVLFKGLNDSIGQARALARLLQGLNCHVNLIPANLTANRSFQPPSPQVVVAFEKELGRLHINATLRQPRGQDIDAGCGQLRSRLMKDTGRKKVSAKA
ncbi:MAG: 23S rRNA (adenine(2503)-C(2))-methyltransferase RlmN [Dehalococcoidales bacterium]